MQDDNLTPEQRRALAFERGESLESDKQREAEISDYQKQQAAQWEKLGAEFANANPRSNDSLEAAGLRDPSTTKSGWDEIANEYSDKKSGDNSFDDNVASEELAEQTNEVAELDQPSVDVIEDPSGQSDVSEAISIESVPVATSTEAAEPSSPLTADAEREIALAKVGAEYQPTGVQSDTMRHLVNRYGADNVQSLEMTDSERAQYDDMKAQASRLGNDTDNPTSINAITGVNKADGDYSQFGKMVDGNGLGALMMDANKATSGNAMDNDLSLSQTAVAASAGRESEMAVAAKVDIVESLDNRQPEPELSSADLSAVNEQLDLMNNQTDKTGFDPGGKADDRAEDNLDEARARVDNALKTQKEADRQNLSDQNDFNLAA